MVFSKLTMCLSDLSLDETPPSPPVNPKFQCGQCNKPLGEKLSKCGRCKLVSYCSKECQTTAWKTHKAACQKPEEETILDSSFKPSDGPIKRFTTNVWDEKQIPENHNQRAKITYIDWASLGFKKNRKEMDTLLEKQRYKEILLHCDADTPLARSKINWLRDCAEKGHCFLMLNLAARIFMEKTEEAVKWYHLGSHCIQLDFTCITDQSAIENQLQTLKGAEETIKTKLPKEAFQKYFAKEYILKIISSWTPKENHPSPKWLRPYGNMVLNGINCMKPQKDWYRLRLEKHQEILKKLKELIEGKSPS